MRTGCRLTPLTLGISLPAMDSAYFLYKVLAAITRGIAWLVMHPFWTLRIIAIAIVVWVFLKVARWLSRVAVP